MEAMLAGKPRSVAIGVLRALVVPLRDYWGDIETFKVAGQDVLAREGGGVLFDPKQSPAHLDQLYRQVQRARAAYFRPIEVTAQLDHLARELDLTAAKAASPLQQGVLWLASRLQQQAIAFLQEKRSEELVAKVLDGVAKDRQVLLRALGNPEQLSLDRVEEALAAFSRDVVGGVLKPFEETALAGHLLERVRKASRLPHGVEGGEELPANDPSGPLIAALVEPVRLGELNEARQRYARLSDDEKTRRFNEFRRALLKVIGEVAEAAPDGFEPFCEAIEIRLFPYPEPLQFIRTFARPIWNSGAQSNIFTNTTTPQSVQHAYEMQTKGRQGNPVVLEIARAFALRNFRAAGQGGKGVSLREVDLKAEFGWPTTIDDLKAAMR